MCYKNINCDKKKIPVSQSLPVLSGGQMHWKSLISSLHVAPSAHGEDAHSLMFILQSGPAKPDKQSHINQFIPSIQCPPLKQGFGLQSSISEREEKMPQYSNQGHFC